MLALYQIEPVDTALLVRSLQEQVVQYSWRHTLDRVQIDFLMLFCLLLMVVLLLVYLYMRRRLRRAVQLERRQRIFQEAHYRNLRLMEEQQKEQESTEEDFRELTPEERYVELMESGIYRLFHRARMEEVRVTDEDWKALQESVITAYPHFLTKLYALVPKLSTIELQICLLVKIGVSVTDIAYVISRTKQAVAVSRARMYKKFTGNDGSAEQFDKFIQGI